MRFWVSRLFLVFPLLTWLAALGAFSSGVVPRSRRHHKPSDNLTQLVERLTLLQRIDKELSDRLDVDYVLEIALDVIIRISRANAGGIGLIENGVMTTGRYMGVYPSGFTQAFPKIPDGIVGRVLRTRIPELVKNVSIDPDYVCRVPGTRAQITIPLLARDRVIGILNVQTHNPAYFSHDVFEFLQIITTRIAVAVDNAQLYQVSQTQLAELQGLYARVSELERLKTDMIRLAAHDLRSPLNVILGFNDLLRDSAVDERQREYSGHVDKAARQMQRLIHDTLSLERIKAVHEQRLEQPISLCEVVETAYCQYQEQAQQKHLDFRLQMVDKPLVAGDAAQLREALENLISNAVKYTPPQGRVEVRLRVVGGQACLEVEDSGYGISPDLQACLFQPFYRVLTPETRNIDGTGLGLHLVKNIVERHNGGIIFTSQYGKGSTFGFALPLATAGCA